MMELLAHTTVVIVLQFMCIKSTLCTFNLHNFMYQVYLNKLGERKDLDDIQRTLSNSATQISKITQDHPQIFMKVKYCKAIITHMEL